MAKKQTAKERREEGKASALVRRLDKSQSKLNVSKNEINVQDNINMPDSENNKNESEIKKESFSDTEKENFSEAKKVFEKNRKNRDWQKKMPSHEVHEVPKFLTDSTMKSEREDVAGMLFELLKTKFSLSTIADILLYNDYQELNEVVEDKREFLITIKKVYPEFSFDFKKKVGGESSRLYSSQEKKVKALLEFFSSGSFTNSSNKHSFQDVVSSVVDTVEFNEACRIESEFIDNEIKVLLENMSIIESSNELEQLMNKAVQLRKELKYKIDAYQTIERLVSGKENKEDKGR